VSTVRSTLYSGTVRHTRLRPTHHDFRYRVFYGFFDIDELGRLAALRRFFSSGSFNLFGFDPGDHGAADGSPLRPWAEERFSEAGVDLAGGRISLLAFPRILGFAFNPIAVWYGYGPDGDLRGVIHEVRNTFGDRHVYVAPVDAEDLRHSGDKRMHVSPFNDMNQTYHFTINDPGERLVLAIRSDDGSGVLFRAGLGLSRLEFTDVNLLRLFVTHPLLTFKVVAGIHWQALRLWLTGVQVHPRPEPAVDNVTVLRRSAA